MEEMQPLCPCGCEIGELIDWEGFVEEILQVGEAYRHCPDCHSIFEGVLVEDGRAELSFYRSEEFEAVCQAKEEALLAQSEDHERCVEVVFDEEGKEYLYLCPDDSIGVGDWVWVPVGKKQELKQALVVSVGYMSDQALMDIDLDWKLVDSKVEG